MKGLRLACRYSCACEHGFADDLRCFCSNGDIDEGRVMDLLSILEPKKFYDLIAQKNKIDSFDIRVISYYWRGVPTELKGGIWHNLTTLFPIANLAIGQIRPGMVDECFIHPAKVLEVRNRKLVVEYFPVAVDGENLILSKKPKKREVENLGLNYLKHGDIVAIHFSVAAEKLEPNDANVLTALTHRSINRFNTIRAKK